MASNNFVKPPEPLNLEDRAHRGENWKNFKREMSYYEIIIIICLITVLQKNLNYTVIIKITI